MRSRTLMAAMVFQVFSAGTSHAADVAAGEQVSERCAICHKFEKGEGNGVGPNLFGISGRKAASISDFQYSTALKSSGIVWSDENLSLWVSGAAKMVPGTKMSFAGISRKNDITNLVAYLDTLK